MGKIGDDTPPELGGSFQSGQSGQGTMCGLEINTGVPLAVARNSEDIQHLRRVCSSDRVSGPGQSRLGRLLGTEDSVNQAAYHEGVKGEG